MLPLPPTCFVQSPRKIAWMAGVLVAILGGMVLAGWVFDIVGIKRAFPRLSTMQANAAISFIFAGLSLILLCQDQVDIRRRRLSEIFAVLVIVIAALTLGEFVLERDFGIDTLLLTERSDTSGLTFPGRMAPATACNFLLFGAALLLSNVHRLDSLVQFLAVAAMSVSLIALTGYMYGVESLYRAGPFSSMALTTAGTFIVLGVGIMFARPARTLMAILCSDSPGGWVARRLMLAALITPLLCNWLQLAGTRMGLFDTNFGLAAVALLDTAVLAAAVYWSAMSLNRTDAKRQHAEAKFRQAVEATPSAIVIVNAEGRIVLVNVQTEKLFGYRREELLDQTVELLVPPQFRAGHPAYRKGFLADPRARAVGSGRDLYGLHKDGSEFPIEIGLSPIETGDGMLVLSAIVDITERKRVERELEAERTLLRTMIDAIPDLVFTKDMAGRFRISNRAHLEFLGLAHESDVGGKSVFELHPAHLAEGYHEDDMRVLRKGETIRDREELARDTSGKEHWRLVIKTPLRDGNGEIIGLVGISRDIQERKLAEEAIRKSEQQLRQITENIREVFWMRDVDNITVLYVSHAYEEIWGRSCQSLIEQPRSWLEAVVDDDRPGVLAALRQPHEGKRQVIEFRVARPNGDVRRIRNSSFPVWDLSGKPQGFAGVSEDITEQKLLEEQFRQAQKMEAIGRLAGGVAHDFNNLLTVITGYSEMVLGLLGPASPLSEPIDQVIRAGERAALLTRQLLAFSRKQVLQVRVLDLNGLLANMEKMLRSLIGEDVDLKSRLAPDLWRIKADMGQLEQVVMNLCLNARDAMPTGGQLTIETANVVLDEPYINSHAEAHAGEHVLLAVSDTGSGMDAVTQAHIFEPFFTTKDPEKGTGLGLATVFGIVKQSGGHVEVYSELGLGSNFKIYLPREREGTVNGKSPAGIHHAPRGSETVLLCEDEEGVRNFARLVLEHKGYTVLEADQGQAAFMICDRYEKTIHLLLTDVVMPNLSGRQVAERVRQMRPGVKVLYMSGYTDDAIIRHGVLEVESPFLQKPFTADALALKVRDVLDATENGGLENETIKKDVTDQRGHSA